MRTFRPRMNRQAWRCWAYDEETGRPCGRPAIMVDPLRGYAVCKYHATWVCEHCGTENSVDDLFCDKCQLPRTTIRDTEAKTR